MKRTTVFLPDGLHEQLRQEAFHARVSMAHLIRTRLQSEVPRPKQGRKPDPLSSVEGIGHDGQLTQGIDEALYGI